jgi:uncharacterized membrane protein
MNRSRLEAFSDGVFAVAITLLALNLAVPASAHGGILGQLGHRWPAFAAYVISFFTVGTIWVNHHALMINIAVIDRMLLFLNLLLLLFVVAIPPTTSTMAGFLSAGGREAQIAAAMYALAFEAMAISFTCVFEWALHKEARLHCPLPVSRRWAARRRFYGGQSVYLAASGLAFAWPDAALVMTALTAVYYMTPAPHVWNHPEPE